MMPLKNCKQLYLKDTDENSPISSRTSPGLAGQIVKNSLNLIACTMFGQRGYYESNADSYGSHWRNIPPDRPLGYRNF